MNIVNGSKSFYRFMKRDGVVLAYFYVDDFWNHSTTEKLKNVFAENNNGNITILMVDFYKHNVLQNHLFLLLFVYIFYHPN